VRYRSAAKQGLEGPRESGLPIGTVLAFHCNVCERDLPMRVVDRWYANGTDWVMLRCTRWRCRTRANYPYFWPELHGRTEWDDDDQDAIMGLFARTWAKMRDDDAPEQ
jgi:hypothetical protein